MAEYGSFGTTALKLDIGTEYSSLGPGLAYLYGPFGDTVGKLVGQYSDSGRVSRLLQAEEDAKGAREIAGQREESRWRVLDIIGYELHQHLVRLRLFIHNIML